MKKNKEYSKDFLLWVIRKLKEELRQTGFRVSTLRKLIEKEKTKLTNTHEPHDNLWKLRFELKRLEEIRKEDLKNLRRYETEYNRCFNVTFQQLPKKRKLIYDKRGKDKTDLEVLQFCLDEIRRGPDYMMTRESKVGWIISEMNRSLSNISWPQNSRKYLKAWPENTRVRLYYNESESGYYVTENIHLIEIL